MTCSRSSTSRLDWARTMKCLRVLEDEPDRSRGQSRGTDIQGMAARFRSSTVPRQSSPAKGNHRRGAGVPRRYGEAAAAGGDGGAGRSARTYAGLGVRDRHGWDDPLLEPRGGSDVGILQKPGRRQNLARPAPHRVSPAAGRDKSGTYARWDTGREISSRRLRTAGVLWWPAAGHCSGESATSRLVCWWSIATSPNASGEKSRCVLQKEQLRALAERLQWVREEDRKRVARDLHDQIGQILTAIKMDMTWMTRHLPRVGRRGAGATGGVDSVDQ